RAVVAEDHVVASLVETPRLDLGDPLGGLHHHVGRAVGQERAAVHAAAGDHAVITEDHAAAGIEHVGDAGDDRAVGEDGVIPDRERVGVAGGRQVAGGNGEPAHDHVDVEPRVAVDQV